MNIDVHIPKGHQTQGRYPIEKLDQSNLLHLFLSVIFSDKKQPFMDEFSLQPLTLVSKRTKKLCDLFLSDVIYAAESVGNAAGVVLTMPNLKAPPPLPVVYTKEMPETENQVAFVFQNNGYLTVTSCWKTPDQYFEYLRTEKPEVYQKMEAMDTTTVYWKINSLFNKLEKMMPMDEMTDEEKKCFLALHKKYDFNCKPRLNSVIIEGQRLSLAQAKINLSEIQDSMEIPILFRGKYLFRSIRTDEWESIKRERKMFIRPRDNFEDKVGSQVKRYKDEQGYAGIIVRIPNKQPYNINAGLQVPRISTAFAHFIHGDEIFVSNTGEESSFEPLINWLS